MSNHLDVIIGEKDRVTDKQTDKQKNKPTITPKHNITRDNSLLGEYPYANTITVSTYSEVPKRDYDLNLRLGGLQSNALLSRTSLNKNRPILFDSWQFECKCRYFFSPYNLYRNFHWATLERPLNSNNRIFQYEQLICVFLHLENLFFTISTQLALKGPENDWILFSFLLKNSETLTCFLFASICYINN